MSQIAEIIYDLKALPCLSVLNEDELVLIGNKAEIKKFARNNLIFSEMDSVEFFFTVRKGSVKLFKTSKEGRELVIRIMNQGDYFCCASFFGEGCHFVSAVALSDTIFTIIPADKFREMLEGMSGISLKIIKCLCSRIKTLSNLLADVTFHDVEQRVMKTLLRLADEKAPNENHVNLMVTHQEIASMTGTVREVVSRTMSKLRKSSAIYDGHSSGFMIDKDNLLLLTQQEFIKLNPKMQLK